MRVLYVGNFEPDHSTENDVRRAFEHLGHSVTKTQERAFIADARAGGDSWQGLVELATKHHDLVVHTMTQGNYPPDVVLDLWRACRDAGVPTASIHLDRFYGLGSVKDSGPQRFDLPRLHPMFKVDHVFTADGDSDELFARDGVNHHWLLPAVRHDEARDIAPTAAELDRFGNFDVGFCGARGYHDEHNRAGLIDALASRYGLRFVRVAGDTEYGTWRGEPLNRLYRTVPVWVGDSCFAGSSSRYTSDRFFETWGRGGFLIHPKLDGLADALGFDYPWWEPYEDMAALFERIDDWLDAGAEYREKVREAVAGEVRAHHTYVNRVEEMLSVIFGTGEEAPSDDHLAGSVAPAGDPDPVADRAPVAPNRLAGVGLQDVYRDQAGELWEVVALCDQPQATVRRVRDGHTEEHVIGCLNWTSKWASGPLR